MITYSRWSLRRSVPNTSGLAAVTVLVWSAFATTGVFAQQETLIIGGNGLPEVEVNLDVLDSLGAPPASPLLAPDVHPTISDPGPAGTVEGTPLKVKASPPVAAKKLAMPVPPEKPTVTATVAPLEPPPPPSLKPSLQIAPEAMESAVPAAAHPSKDAATAPQPAKAPDPALTDAVAHAKTQAAAAPATPPKPPEAKPTVEPTTVAASTPTEANTPEPAAASEPLPVPPSPIPEPAAGSGAADAAKVTAKATDATATDATATNAKAGDPIRIEYDGDSTRLPEESWNDLRVFAQQLLRSKSLRVQVKAFAGNSAASKSSARRLSLSRALGVRAFLIERGVRSTQIDVRAMGKKSEGGPPERVDVVLVNR